MGTSRFTVRAGGLLAVSLAIWACGANDSANQMDEAAGAGGVGCPEIPHALTDLCDNSPEPCPLLADSGRERALCQSPDVPGTRAIANEVDRFETTCGGFVFVEQYSLFSERWEYDANGELVSASPATSDVATECLPPSFFGAEPCARVSNEPKVLCKDSQSFAGAGSGGAGGVD
jgi:hypothetical protein